MLTVKRYALPILLVLLCLESPLTIYTATEAADANRALAVRANDRSKASAAVQRRQLVAGACLIAVVDDIHALFAVPLTAQERRQEAREPAAVRRLYRKLNADAGAFQAVADSLPRPQCP